MKKVPELLLPAGSIEKMDYAELAKIATEILNESIKTINHSCHPHICSNDDANRNSNVFIRHNIPSSRDIFTPFNTTIFHFSHYYSPPLIDDSSFLTV